MLPTISLHAATLVLLPIVNIVSVQWSPVEWKERSDDALALAFHLLLLVLGVDLEFLSC